MSNTESAKIGPDAKVRTIPCTPLQLGMLYHALSASGTGVDIEQIRFDLEEAVRVDDLIRAFETVAARHSILRARFDWDGGEEPRLIVDGPVRIPVQHLDLTKLDTNEQRSKIEALIEDDRRTDFEMNVAPLMRLKFVELGEDRVCGLWSFHHALLDGRSFPLILSEVFALYDGADAQSLPARRPFEDFAQHLTQLPLATHEAFWRERLAGLESATPIELPADGQPQDPHGGAFETRLSESETSDLRSCANEYGVTLNTLVQAAWGLVVHHWSQKSDIAFGVIRACRHALDDTEDAVGLFINTLPMRLTMHADMSVADYLSQVRSEQIALRPFETTPLHLIQQWSPTPNNTALFNSIVMFDEQSLAARMDERLGSDTRRFDYTGQTNFPLTLLAYGDSRMLIRLEFSRSEFSLQTAERLVGQVRALLSGFVDQKTLPALKLPYLSAADIETFESWNATDTPYELETTLADLLEAQVNATPKAVALQFGDQSLSYEEFNTRVNQLAHRLIGHGIKADSIVGVYAERSFEMLIAMHAAIKAGGAYVPLDPDHPPERLGFMLDDTNASVVITQSHLAGRIPAGPVVIAADDPKSGLDTEPVDNPALHRSAQQLAYVLYTSGSTGRPKGVMNEHRGIVNRLEWMQQAYRLTGEDVVLQKTPSSFDVSVWELFWPLIKGARLVIAQPDGHRDTDYLTNCIEQYGVTTMHFVPSMLQLFLEDPNLQRCKSLKRVICSGEALPRDLQDKFFARLPHSELHNLYGPTEAAIDVSWWQCDPDSTLKTVPIGASIANTQLHILDPLLQRIPIGVAGELHIGGVQVARGYLNRSELTAEKFIADPYADNSSARIYKTGDLVRYLPDGNIEYLGRLDFQVKIRGFRIELGEIETTLLDHPDIRECVVVAREDQSGSKQLVAYLVSDNSSLSADEIKTYLGKSLTAYMVPGAIVMLDKLPLNSSGKVDRSALPAPELPHKSDAIAPRHDTERKVASVWCEVLNLESVSVGDTFFDLGGNSLLLIRLANGLTKEMERKVAISDLLRCTTVEQQAAMFQTPADGADQKTSSASKLALQQRNALARRRRRPPGATR